MDTYNLVTKISYMIMLMTAVAFLLQIHYGGLLSIDTDIDQQQKQQFTRMVVLENTLSYDLDDSQLSHLSYTLERRRAVYPIELFNSTRSDENSNLGVLIDGDNCYLPRVAGLDGQEYGFYVKFLEDPSYKSPDHETILDECSEAPSSLIETPAQRGQRELLTDRISYAPALVYRKAKDNPPIPVRVYVYDVQ